MAQNIPQHSPISRNQPILLGRILQRIQVAGPELINQTNMPSKEKVITISSFETMANDYANGGFGEFSITKHFDTFTYPKRLSPLRGMTAESQQNSSIGNMIVATDGLMYGVGVDYPGNPTKGQLWVRSGYGGSDGWVALSTAQLSGATIRSGDYAFLVEYPDAGNSKTMFWASTNLLVASNLSGGAASASTQALTFTTISQGFVHPSDKVLYFGYQTATQTFIGTISADATPFNTHNFTALQLPSRYRVTSLTNYGDYLAISCTSAVGNGFNSSVVLLWDRVTATTTISQIIPWGTGSLQVLNNMGGVLVGVSSMSSTSTGNIQDQDALIVKTYSGGAEPITQKEVLAQRLTSTVPSVTINPNVNFMYRDRLYFSANVVNGGAAPAYYGLWSFGRTKTGRWGLTIERMATNAGTETGVLAAAISGDFVAMCHTALGTLTYTQNGNTLSAIYGATSVYESTINPGMDELDGARNKKLVAIFVNYLPLPAAGSVTFKYRVNVTADAAGTTLGNGWTTVFTETTDGEVSTEMTRDATGTAFTDGTNYEFRIESTGGAIITSWGYKYQTLPTNI